jgi:hypothetical protein
LVNGFPQLELASEILNNADMKRFVVTLAVLLCFTMMMTGADIRSLVKVHAYKPTLKMKKNCVGYTILEADKGIDCYGDTVQLKKTHGYYEVVTLSK